MNRPPRTTTAELTPPRPDLAAPWREAAGLLALPRLGLSLGDLARDPAGNGSLVLVLPGFGAGDASTWPLRAFLASRGHRVQGWGLGANRLDVPSTIAAMADAVVRHADRQGAPVALVGWSLGGYIAREVAREQPAAVRRVVTLGRQPGDRRPPIHQPGRPGALAGLGSRLHRGRGGTPQTRAPAGARHGDLQPQGRRRRLAGLHRPRR